MKKVVTIESLCDKITDGSHFSPEDDSNGSYPMYSVKDMEYNGFAKSGYKLIGQDTFTTLSNSDCRPLKDDILIAKDGSYLKYVFKVNEDLDACILSSIAILRPLKSVNPDYLVYLMRLPSVKNAMASYVSGSALPRIILSDFKKMKIEINDDEDYQSRVAGILSAYDSLIEANNKRIKILEQMAENLYKEWFVRFRFPGYETAEFENGIPKGWEYKTVEGLSCVLQRGISPDYDDDGEYSVISQKCIRQSIMDFSEARKHTKKFKSELNILDGDTVICSTGTGTLGRVGQVYGAYQNTTFDSHVTLVRANNDVGSHFLFWALKNMQPWFMNMGIGSTNQQELYRSTIKNAG